MHRAIQHQASRARALPSWASATLTLLASLGSASVLAQTAAELQTSPGTQGVQTQAVAEQPATPGVALAELSPQAPEQYVVQRGDTSWGIARLYLQQPWRWPQLWGMNKQAISNPHRIYPGQTLYLSREAGVARLSTLPPGSPEAAQGEPQVVRLSPHTRTQNLADLALPTLKPHLIEPFLVEPVVVDDATLEQAPRIIATTEERVLMASGHKAYVRGDATHPLLREPGDPRRFQVYRNAEALKDPQSGALLGYEAQYLGKAELLKGEGQEEYTDGQGQRVSEYVPATVLISAAKEEIRAGDRLLPAPERSFASYAPHAPEVEVDARVVSIYGSAKVAYAGQNQVVAINRGADDGLSPGHVLHLVTKGERIVDNTDPGRPTIKLPSERNGTAMVFRTFDRVSYVLLLEIENGVRVGDRLVNPR